jgi:hypothetical protein
MVGLREIDRRRSALGRGVLVALEDEVEKKRRRGVAAQRSAPEGIDERLPAHEIVGQFSRALEIGVGLHVDDLDLGGLGARQEPESRERSGDPRDLFHGAPLFVSPRRLRGDIHPSFF